MHYDPRVDLRPAPLKFNPLNALAAPRPIAWVSTVSGDGVPNLAPFSYYNAFSSDPPIVAFAPNEKDNEKTPKDTLSNLREVPEFVVNVVTHDLRHAMNHTSKVYPSSVNEFEKAGIETAPSKIVAPLRVAAARASFECEVYKILALPRRGGGRQSHIVIGAVVQIHIADEIINKDGRIDASRLPLLSRLGYFEYSTVSEVFEIPRPK